MKKQLTIFAFDIPINDDMGTKKFFIQGNISEETTASLYQKEEMDVIRVTVVVEENTNEKVYELGVTPNTPKYPNILRISDAVWYGHIVARKKQELMEFNVHITAYEEK